MIKECSFCSATFKDKTKNKNRLICGSIKCKKERKRQYNQSVDKNKKLGYMRDFYKRDPGYQRAYRIKNIHNERIRGKLYKRKLLKTNTNARIACNVRNRLYKIVKSKSCNTKDLLGCSFNELRQHLESMWSPGMSWENYSHSGWHIDHIRPLSSFDLTNSKDLKEAMHYSNLQPLWASENMSKGAKYDLH